MQEVLEEVTDQTNPLVPHRYPGRIRDKVCIIGFAESTRDQVNWDDPDMEYWGINRLHVVLDKPFDRYFQLHDIEASHGTDEEHLQFLRDYEGMLYMRPEDLGMYDIEAEAFPYKALTQDFFPYFTNTISWLIALAIMMGFEEIHLFGIDMAQDTLLQKEYSQQRPSCEYFIGLAQGMGIKVIIPEASDLLKTAQLYGLGDSDLWISKMQHRLSDIGKRKEDVKQRILQLDSERNNLIASLNQLDGAMQDVEYWIRTWSPELSK